MLLTREPQQDLLIRAMRAGIREVLELPLVHRAFHEAMDRIEVAAGVSHMRDGKVLAFISCKGGSGATFLSTNFGYALAALADKKVLLIDLHGQFGDATLYVSDQKPAMTLSDICAQISRMDGSFLDSCLVHVASNFGVLAAADDPNHAVDMKPEHMDAILRVARQHYDYIVLDVGRQIDAISLRALDQADIIHPVLQLALPDIRDGRRLLDIFRSLGYPSERTRLIVNRYEKGGKLRLTDLEQALGADVVHTVPNDYLAATDSVNQGIPVLQLSRSSAVARSLAELVELVTARRVSESKGLFDRLFGRNDSD
jgi:pilus assembly protein CpaE